jgi:hypothetical protein
METQSLVSQLETLLPLAVSWARENQSRILAEGVPLSEPELFEARRVGVKQPERVRLLSVPTIPFPAHPLLQAACRATNLVPESPRGLTLFYGIYLRSDCWRDRSIVVHELVHTAQYERLGGIDPFLRSYLGECMTFGYANSSMENEARAAASRLCQHA